MSGAAADVIDVVVDVFVVVIIVVVVTAGSGSPTIFLFFLGTSHKMWSPGGNDFSSSIADFITFIMSPPFIK